MQFVITSGSMYVNMSDIIGRQLDQSDSGYKYSADNLTTYDRYKKAETVSN